MTEIEIKETIEELLQLEASSFVRYVIEVSRPPVVDDADRRALALFQDLYRETERGLRALSAVPEEPLAIRRGRWPLRFASYNYLRPRYVLAPFARELEEHVERLARAAEPLAGEEAAAAAVARLLEAEKEHIERLRKLAAELEPEPAAPAALKGTSASRW
jgi:hypothetical protein